MAHKRDKNLDITIFVFVLSTTKDILDFSKPDKRINYFPNPCIEQLCL